MVAQSAQSHTDLQYGVLHSRIKFKRKEVRTKSNVKTAASKTRQVPAAQGTPLFDYLEKLGEDNPSTEKVSHTEPQFPGPSYQEEFDFIRLSGLQYAVFNLMKDGNYRTHSEIREAINRGSENGIAAMLRNLRHSSRGSHTVNKRRRGDPTNGLWEYQLVPNSKNVVLEKEKKPKSKKE